MTLCAKMAVMSDSRWYPIKHCLIKYKLGYMYVFNLKKFHFGFLYKIDFHIIDQIKVSRVPLWNGHCHLCITRSLKLLLHITQPLSIDLTRRLNSTWRNWTHLVLVSIVISLNLTLVYESEKMRKRWILIKSRQCSVLVTSYLKNLEDPTLISFACVE